MVAGTMLLRLCMLPGLLLLIWAAPRVARHVGANGAASLWICVLNPLVIVHLMGGVHNEMLMVGLMMAAIALTFAGRPVIGVSLIAIAVAVKATAGPCVAVPGLGVDAPTAEQAGHARRARIRGRHRRLGSDLRRGVRGASP